MPIVAISVVRLDHQLRLGEGTAKTSIKLLMGALRYKYPGLMHYFEHAEHLFDVFDHNRLTLLTPATYRHNG